MVKLYDKQEGDRLLHYRATLFNIFEDGIVAVSRWHRPSQSVLNLLDVAKIRPLGYVLQVYWVEIVKAFINSSRHRLITYSRLYL